MSIVQEMWNQWHILDFGSFYTYSNSKSDFLELFVAISDTYGRNFPIDMKRNIELGQVNMYFFV